MIEVRILSPQGVFFNGKAQSAIFPGERGVFEILPFHRPFLTRLIGGTIAVDQFRMIIERGVVQVTSNKVTAIVEA